jgi:hypothetical protein
MNYVKILSEGLTTKVGDISTQFRFQLLNEYRSPVDLSSHTVTIQIATDSTALIQRVLTPTDAVNGVVTFSFEADDSIGYGQRDIEFIVEGSVNEREVYPSDGYLRMNIQPNLLDRDGSEEIRVSLLDVQTKASEAADYANEQGDYAKAAGDSAISEWENPVNTFDDLVTVYPSPTLGDTAQTLDNGHIYRFNGTEWKYIQGYGATAIADINAKLEEFEQQTQTLQNGLNVLSSDQASPLKVEFYGVTRANLLGKVGNFEKDSNGDGVADGWGKWLMGSTATLETGTFGTKAQRITSTSSDTGTTRFISKDVNLKAGKHYLFAVNVSTDESSTGRIKFTSANLDFTNSGVKYQKYTPSSDETRTIYLYNVNAIGTVGWVQFDGARLIEISQATYDKIGDLSLIGKDQEYVEKAFPYVSGVQSVVNPVIRVAGANLLPPFYEWELDENANIISPYKLELNATGNFQESYYDLEVLPNQEYYYQIEGMSENGRIIARCLDIDKNALTTIFAEGTLTTTSNTSYIRIEVDNGGYGAGTFTFSQPMLTLGSEPRPFVPKNDSYLYAYKVNEETGENEPLILAGNEDKKDISYYNEDKRRWEKRGHFKVDDMLDGSRDWTYNRDNAGFKNFIIRTFDMNTTSGHTPIVSKFDGSLVDRVYSSTTPNTTYFSDGHLYLTIYDAETGFTEEMTPSTDLIKSYFYGYFYRGDGTTHSWRPIGDTDDTRLTTTLPTSPSPTMLDGTIQPYKLTYQLAEPIVEEVRVEGDLSIQGSSQISVGEGVIVREEVVPAYDAPNKLYKINHKTLNSKLANKSNKIIKIYRNGKEDISWVIGSNGVDYYGGAYAYTTDAHFDPNATYTVTYEILDKHDFTTNLNEVVAHYNSSIKSSIQSVVSKQSGIATDVSVLDGTVYDMLVRLKKLEQEGAV